MTACLRAQDGTQIQTSTKWKGAVTDSTRGVTPHVIERPTPLKLKTENSLRRTRPFANRI